MKKSEYLTLLQKRYQAPIGIDEYIKDGVTKFWGQYEKNTGLIAPSNLHSAGLDLIENFYGRCFDTALSACELPHKQIAYKQFFTHKYNARLAPLKDSQLIIVDASLYSSFVAYFVCIYHLAFSDPDSDLRGRIVRIFISEMEFHLACLKGSQQEAKVKPEYWIEISSMDKDIMTWAALSAECLLIFIILHEIGHIYYNHNESNSDGLDGSLFKSFKKKQELQADRFASKTLNKILESQNIHNLTLDFMHTPILFFRVLELLDLYKIRVYKESPISNEFYPSYIEREEALEKRSDVSNSLLLKPITVLEYLKSLILLASQNT